MAAGGGYDPPISRVRAGCIDQFCYPASNRRWLPVPGSNWQLLPSRGSVLPIGRPGIKLAERARVELAWVLPRMISSHPLLPVQPPLQTNQTPMPSYRVDRFKLPETIYQKQTSNLHLHCRQILAEGERLELPCGFSHGCFRGSSLTSWGQPSSLKTKSPCLRLSQG